jgi:hypothetical protein
MLGEDREPARVTKHMITGHPRPLRLRQRLLRLARGKAREWDQRTFAGLRFVNNEHTSIGWHASPKSTTRPFGWTQVESGLRSMRRHFSVDLTNDRSFWTLRWQRDESILLCVQLSQSQTLRTAAQNQQNPRASCLRCLLPSMTQQIHCLGGLTRG